MPFPVVLIDGMERIHALLHMTGHIIDPRVTVPQQLDTMISTCEEHAAMYIFLGKRKIMHSIPSTTGNLSDAELRPEVRLAGCTLSLDTALQP